MNDITRLGLIVYDHIFEMRRKFRENEVVDVDRELFELYERIWNDQSYILEHMEKERKGKNEMTIDELIERIENDIDVFSHHGKWQEEAYYDRCAAKLDYAEDILYYLKEIKKNG